MESLKAKLVAAGYPNADIDDVLSYALFPDVALAYFKNTVDLNTQKPYVIRHTAFYVFYAFMAFSSACCSFSFAISSISLILFI